MGDHHSSSVTIELIPEEHNSTVKPDDPFDIFTQDEPELNRAIFIKYTSAGSSSPYIRVFDVEQLNVWLERQPASKPRDPVISSIIFTDSQRAEVAQRAARVFCTRRGLDPEKDGVLFIAIRLQSDEELKVTLAQLSPSYWTQANLWMMLEEAVQRRRAVAIASLYDLGVTLFHFNINTLATLVVSAVEQGWPTRELLRLMYLRIPDRHTNRKLGYLWSHAIVLILTVTIQAHRYRDVTRIMRRLVQYVHPLHLRDMRLVLKPILIKDAVLQILFHQYDLRSAGIMAD